MDGWQTCHYFLLLLHVIFLSCGSLTQRHYISVTLTLLVRETAQDNQERTSDVLRIPCCVTFDHVRTVDVVTCLPELCDMQQLLYRSKVYSVQFDNCMYVSTTLFLKNRHVGVYCESKRHHSPNVYQSLMVWSNGRSGHLRLLPDSEYDEDG